MSWSWWWLWLRLLSLYNSYLSLNCLCLNIRDFGTADISLPLWVWEERTKSNPRAKNPRNCLNVRQVTKEDLLKSLSRFSHRLKESCNCLLFQGLIERAIGENIKGLMRKSCIVTESKMLCSVFCIKKGIYSLGFYYYDCLRRWRDWRWIRWRTFRLLMLLMQQKRGSKTRRKEENEIQNLHQIQTTDSSKGWREGKNMMIVRSKDFGRERERERNESRMKCSRHVFNFNTLPFKRETW